MSTLQAETGLTGRLGTRPLLGAAWLVALAATGGSLYLSEVLGLVPCELCWVQRIFAYPLVVVLGVATVEGRASVVRSVLPLSTLGAATAAYHSYLQATATGTTCGGGVSCAAVQYQLFGLSVPNLALTAFLLIGAASVTAWFTQ